MSEFVESSRRGFLGGLLAVIATPAIIRVAKLMPVKVMPSTEVLDELFIDEVYPVTGNNLLTIQMITREAIRLWKNSNLFMQNIDGRYDRVFGADDVKIGTTLRIRQPLSFA